MTEKFVRKSKQLARKQYDQMLGEGDWQEDQAFAQFLSKPEVYNGPNNQMLIVGMGQKHAICLNWGREFKELVATIPPGPHTIMALCQIRLDDFVAKLNKSHSYSIVEAAAHITLVDPKYPLADGQAFTDALLSVGDLLIEWKPTLAWRIEAKDGVVTGAKLTSLEATYPIDLYMSDLLSEHGKISDYARRGPGYFVEILKFRIKIKTQ